MIDGFSLFNHYGKDLPEKNRPKKIYKIGGGKMRNPIRMMLAVIIFACGYMMGSMDSSAFHTKTAHAMQGPKIESLSCNLSVKTSCNKVDGSKYAYLTITGTPAVDKAWGARFSNNIYSSPMIQIRLQ